MSHGSSGTPGARAHPSSAVTGARASGDDAAPDGGTDVLRVVIFSSSGRFLSQDPSNLHEETARLVEPSLADQLVRAPPQRQGPFGSGDLRFVPHRLMKIAEGVPHEMSGDF